MIKKGSDLMKKNYDDFTKLKLKDMSKSMSDMTYKYINPETLEPTKVPAQHYEKILEQVQENYLGEITKVQFLNIMYNQLQALKKDDEKYFTQALLCIDMGINPKDMRLDEQISLSYTYNYLDDKRNNMKKDFHLLDKEIVEIYNTSKNDPYIQGQAIQISNMVEEKENYAFNNKNINKDVPER